MCAYNLKQSSPFLSTQQVLKGVFQTSRALVLWKSLFIITADPCILLNKSLQYFSSLHTHVYNPLVDTYSFNQNLP